MNEELREIIQALSDANKDAVSALKQLLSIVQEHEKRIHQLEQKNG